MSPERATSDSGSAIPLTDVASPGPIGAIPAPAVPAKIAARVEDSPLRARFGRNLGMFGVAVIVVVAAAGFLDAKMIGSVMPTGWLLFAAMVVLAAYGLKKKLPFLPLGTSASWLQFHLYLGLLTVVLFGLHIRFRMPTGALEISLAVLYLTVALSGVVGLILVRVIPPRLRGTGEAVLYSRIPKLTREVREEAEGLVLGAVSASGATTIADVYVSRLEPFFARTRNAAAHLFGATRALREVLDEIDDAYRYADDEEKKVLGELKSLVKQKHVLDANYAFQTALRVWLFVHVPATGALLVVSVAHALAVHAFRGLP